MTSPQSVGEVSVEIVGEVKGLAKKIRNDLKNAFKDLDLSKAIRDAVSDSNTTVKVTPEVDTSTIGEQVKKTKAPKAPVTLDPLLTAFQQEVRRQTSALARTANANIPVGADTSKLRSEISSQLAAIQASSKAKIPTEPADRASYEAQLRAQLAAVAARVKQTVKVDVDVNGGRGGSGGVLGGISAAFRALPDLGGITNKVADLTGAFQKLGGTSAQAGGAMAGAVQSAAGPVGLIVSLLVAAAGAAALFATAGAGIAIAIPILGAVAAGLAAVAGAAAAIPGALAGAGAAFGALSLGFSGISDAFKPKAGGGGGGGGGGGEDPASRARRIAGAERGVEAARRGITSATRGVQAAERSYRDAVEAVSIAQLRAGKAQAAVNKARKEAKEDLDDLGRSLRGAVLDEEDATLAVTEALRELNQVKLTGNLPDIQRADLEYRKAQLTLENATDTVGDLGEEHADAAKKGVEGSDKVQAALEDQADAFRAVRQAQDGVLSAQDGLLAANDAYKSSLDGLKSAQDALLEAQKKTASGGGGGGGFGKEIVKLAPAAQKFVDAVKALKPAFEGLRLDVQQKLFAGLDKTVTNLGNAWIPALKTTLGSYATTFNGFFKTLGANISTPAFIKQLQTGAEGARKGLSAIGDAISGPLVQAFGRLSAASAPFLEKAGKVIADLIGDFSRWINTMDQEKLDGFFKDAGDAFASLGVTAKETGRLVGNLFGIIFRGNGKKDKSAVDSFNDGLDKINDWLEDPENQKKIEEFFADLKRYYDEFKKTFSEIKGVLDQVLPDKTSAEGKSRGLGDTIGRALIAGIGAGVAAMNKALFDLVAEQLWRGPDSLVGEIKSALGIKSPSTVMAEIGKDLIRGLIQGIGDLFGSLVAKAAQIPGKIKAGIGTVTTFLSQKGKDFATGLMNGMGSLYETVKTKATGLKNKAKEAFSNAATLLTGSGRQLGGGVAVGISALAGSVKSQASGLKSQASSGMSGSDKTLRGAGYALIQGLKVGIENAKPGLGAVLGAVTAFIKNNKGPIEKDRKLLIPAGQAIMQGLSVGINDGRKALGRDLGAISDQIAGGVTADVLARSAGGLNALTAQLDLAAPAPAPAPMLTIDRRHTGNWLIDGLKRDIKLVYHGDPNAALGSA